MKTVRPLTVGDFFNAAKKDYDGKSTSVLTYKLLGVEQGGSNRNALRPMDARLAQVTKRGRGTDASDEDCAMIGAALHYATDLVNPMHSSGFSGGQLPLMLHPVFEYYIPTVQSRYRSISAWNKKWKDIYGPYTVGYFMARQSNERYAVKLMKALRKPGSICTITPEAGMTYTGYCFVNDPTVDSVIRETLRDGYQTTASWIRSVGYTKFYI